MDNKKIRKKVKETLIEAASHFRKDQIEAYRKAIDNEENDNACWILKNLLDNALVAEESKSPLCDDTGIPHVILELSPDRKISNEFITAIEGGVADGLRELPGRPMAIMGDDISRIEQSEGLDPDSGAFPVAPIMILPIEKEPSKLHILMQGGGPEIRSKTYRVFHKHSIDVVRDEICRWATDEVANLGCTPTTLAIGIGRSHYEAASLMLMAMIEGRYDKQTELEKHITNNVNKSNVGPLGLGGITVLATFLKVGPQRASGVRIVCMRPCCCVEPRVATTTF